MTRLNKNLFIAVGLIFAIALSAEVLHDHSSNTSSQIECQLCNNEISESFDSGSTSGPNYIQYSQTTEVSENLISLTPQHYSSRAPPKI